MDNQASNFRDILAKYLHLSGIRISVFLKDGSRINLENAVIKKDYILNNYYQDLSGMLIPLNKIEYAELYTD